MELQRLLRPSRWSLAPRLILLMSFVMLAVVGVDFLSKQFVPLPDIYIYEQNWLINQIAETRDKAQSVTGEQRNAVIKAASQAQDGFDIFLTPPDGITARQGPLTETLVLLQKALQKRLGDPSPPIISVSLPHATVYHRMKVMTVIVRNLPTRMIDELEEKGQGDIAVFTLIRIDVPLRDGTWLTFKTRDFAMSPWVYLRVFIGPVFGILMILIMSVWMARSLLRPLQKLSLAAERLGRERHIIAIPEMHIPEFKNIADAFSETQIRLKRFVDERTHMLAAISHDLRTLLTRMRLLTDNIPDRDKKEQILAVLQDMETMIREYLVFARDDARQEPYMRVDIASLLISVCDTLQDEGNAVTYSGPYHALMHCQPVAMRRVFANIIQNGCKYGESAAVSLTEEKDAITVRIADRGPGIPEPLMEDAFKPFHRLETSRNRDTGGTGLGLAIARDIIRAHGGDIRLTNVPGGGLAAIVRLPTPGRPLY
ncbi:sensor histidine kinase [Martelella alba]|uniref:histidine kinase n=1 Tax=Martelella alba TaxID=2590451 RepID=A0ABY2SFJ2_9HYPH|nr:ATP-binding protein [Martelella alba]TKI03360.1 HAMP domain-containing protein [Martelella alba]